MITRGTTACALITALALALAGCRSGPETSSELQADPRYAEARHALAAGDAATAVKTFQALVPSHSEDPELLRWLGRARIAAGDGAGGRGNLRQALSRKPDDLQARMWLADSLFEEHLHSDAVETYETVRAADPENEHALRRIVELRLVLGEQAKALRILEQRLLRVHPEEGALLILAIQAAIDCDQYDSAARHARIYLRSHPEDPAIHEALALAIVRRAPLDAEEGDLREAIIQLGESVRLDPMDPGFQCHLGLMFDALARKTEFRGDFSSAERHYRRAIEIDPGFLEAIENLADMHIHQRSPQKARPLLEEAIRLELELEQRTGAGTRKKRIELLREKWKAAGGGS